MFVHEQMNSHCGHIEFML